MNAATRTARFRPRSLILTAITLGLLVWLGIYLARHLYWETISERGAFNGEAITNPYHAGMQMMAQLGYPARKLAEDVQPASLPTHSTLLLESSSLVHDRNRREALLKWLRDGGHLVLPLSRHKDLSALLEPLGVTVLGWQKEREFEYPVWIEYPPRSAADGAEENEEQQDEDDRHKGVALQLDLGHAPVFSLRDPVLWHSDMRGYLDIDKDESERDEDRPVEFITNGAKDNMQTRIMLSVVARMKVGRGTLTLAPAQVMNNRRIDENDHAEFFVRMTSLPGERRPIIVVLTPQHGSLMAWLATHAWAALWATLVLLLALLWRSMPRFGPLLPEPPPVRPGLLEHISAVGDFLLRQREYEALIAPLREEVQRHLAHLRGRHPEIDSSALLAARISGLSPDAVTEALDFAPTNAREFHQRSQTLAQLREHCHRLRQPAAMSPSSS